MKLALTTILAGDTADFDLFLTYHRRAGIDVVVVGGDVPAGVERDVERHVRDGLVRRVDADSASDLARVAARELSVDWIVPSATDEFWWPRGENLKDVLAVVPPRYGVVQALVRTFVPSENGYPPETWTVRNSLLGPDGAGGASVEELLRPVYRSSPDIRLDSRDWTLAGRRVPLRAWYPIEVFRYPAGEAAIDDARLEVGLADRSLVVDTRLRDALRSDPNAPFPIPTIVDDASYAVECAAVGEVDLVELDRQIRLLEHRIAELEARFWPTVRRVLKRLARRPS